MTTNLIQPEKNRRLIFLISNPSLFSSNIWNKDNNKHIVKIVLTNVYIVNKNKLQNTLTNNQ